MSGQLGKTKYLRDLRHGMLNNFDQGELKVLAVDLSINWDDLSGDTSTTKVQALIMHFARLGQLDDLVAILREEKPNVDWPLLPPSEQQALDEQTLNPTQGDWVGGDKINIGNLSSVKGMAVGREAQAANIEGDDGMVIQAGGDVKLGKELRDEQYEIVLNWEARGTPRMRGFDLSGRDLSGLSLHNADLQNADLSHAILSNSFGSLSLQGANLRKANLQEAFMSFCNLRNAYLRYADLRMAYLGEANLTEADLKEANLSGAVLSGANLSGAVLSGANLSEAVLSGVDLNRAKYDVNTKWSDGFDPKAAGAILVDEEGNPIEG